MDYNDFHYSYSPSYHTYAFQEPPTGLETHATAIMNSVYESHECLIQYRCRVSVGVLPTVVAIEGNQPNQTK